MCTLSFEYTLEGYRVYFNRDESKSRAIARPPQRFGEVLMPIDAEKGGTWISANSLGICVCILNNYQAPSPSPEAAAKLHSRGELVKVLSTCNSKAELLNKAAQIDPRLYPGFKLVAFGRDFNPFTLEPSKSESNKLSEHKVHDWPVSSSSYSSEVMAVRKKCFKEHFRSDLLAFHKSHHPEKGPYSVCVHREHVETVSLTRVTVGKDNVVMDYASGSPCSHGLEHSCSIALNDIHSAQALSERGAIVALA